MCYMQFIFRINCKPYTNIPRQIYRRQYAGYFTLQYAGREGSVFSRLICSTDHGTNTNNIKYSINNAEALTNVICNI